MDRTESGPSKEDMQTFAKHIDDYLELFLSVFIIPESLRDQEDEINRAIVNVRKLVKKLKKGDESVFKDMDDWKDI